MTSLRNISIKSKLVGIICLVSLVSMAAGFTFVIDDVIRSYKKDMVHDSEILGRLICDNILTAVAFDDVGAAEKILKTLEAAPYVEACGVYDQHGRPYALYRRDSTDTTTIIHDPYEEYSTKFEGKYLTIILPLEYSGGKYGYIHLRASTRLLQTKINHYLKTVVIATGILILVSYFLAYWLQGLISRPILILAGTAEEISSHGDYSIRAEKSAKDEIGSLYDSFNAMLEQIQTRGVERDRAEQALHESEAKFRAFTENTTDVTIVLDKNNKIIYNNPAMSRQFGLPNEQLLGTTLEDMTHPDDSPVAEKTLAEAIADPGQTFSFPPIRVRHGDGQWFYIEGTATCMYDIAGVDGLVINCRDVTERIKTETELKEFARRLEQSNSQLQEFASVASHDLQEPLRKIRAFGDRLKTACQKQLSDKEADYLNRMQNAADRMQTLINDLLAFSRITSKAKSHEPVDIARVAGEVLTDLEVRIEELNAKIEIGPLPTIQAEPFQMRQLLQNLIGNALKFHRPGVPPVVKIYAATNHNPHTGQSIPCGRCCLYVEDNGIGFEEKYVDRIFTIFQRLHGRNEYEGTGIGLAVCRKIVERHGGSITAMSTPGKGSIFMTTLPLSLTQGGNINESGIEAYYHPAGRG